MMMKKVQPPSKAKIKKAWVSDSGFLFLPAFGYRHEASFCSSIEVAVTGFIKQACNLLQGQTWMDGKKSTRLPLGCSEK
jgi:hypothetical protein